MITKAGPDDRYAAFRHGAFSRYLAARVLASFAAQIVSVAVGWQIYDLTRDPFDLGLVGIVQFLPALLLVLVTGAVVDRFGRRMIMGIACGVEAVCALALLFLSWHGLTSPGPVFAVLAGLRSGPRFLRPVIRIADRQSGAPGGLCQRRRLELVGLADCQHRRAGRRRIALRAGGEVAYGAAALHAWRWPPCSSFSFPSRRSAARPTSRPWTRCLPAFGTSGATRSCSARSRSTSSPCCFPGRWRCCRSMPATSSCSGHGGWGCCAPLPGSARSWSASG